MSQPIKSMTNGRLCSPNSIRGSGDRAFFDDGYECDQNIDVRIVEVHSMHQIHLPSAVYEFGKWNQAWDSPESPYDHWRDMK